MRKVRTVCSIAASRPVPGPLNSVPNAFQVGSPSQRLPVLDIIETSERTRSGLRIAAVWAIIPPIEAPTRCADSIPRWSISPIVSAAISRSM